MRCMPERNATASLGQDQARHRLGQVPERHGEFAQSLRLADCDSFFADPRKDFPAAIAKVKTEFDPRRGIMRGAGLTRPV